MSNFTPSGSIGRPLCLTWRYAGIMTATLCPRRASSTGRAPHTSASPPVLAKGATSLLAKTMFKRRSSRGHESPQPGAAWRFITYGAGTGQRRRRPARPYFQPMGPARPRDPLNPKPAVRQAPAYGSARPPRAASAATTPLLAGAPLVASLRALPRNRVGQRRAAVCVHRRRPGSGKFALGGGVARVLAPALHDWHGVVAAPRI